MSIVVENVSKTYGEQLALNNVSFTVDPDEIVGFIGPNGAGKSTLMKIICSYLSPSQGIVRVNGTDVSQDPLSVRKNIGYLPENNPLYPEMYVREYLEFVAGILKISEKKRRIEEIIDLTGLSAEKHKKIGALSKGYRQRVGIAQALIHDPSVVILDEPTTGLDPNQILEIRNLISTTGKGKTIMLSTHIMQEVEAICSRIIVINRGEIVANDKTSEIRLQSGEHFYTVSVEFNSEVSLEKLDSIKGVGKAVKIKDKNYLVQGESKEDIRENIFRFAVEEGLTVLALQKIEKSLEDVFQELTRK